MYFMKKFLKAAMAIALVATMLVASLIVVSAEETNLASGASYTIVRLSEDLSAEEDGPVWIGEGNGDDVNYTRLTDGWKKPAESTGKYSVYTGSNLGTAQNLHLLTQPRVIYAKYAFDAGY